MADKFVALADPGPPGSHISWAFFGHSQEAMTYSELRVHIDMAADLDGHGLASGRFHAELGLLEHVISRAISRSSLSLEVDSPARPSDFWGDF